MITVTGHTLNVQNTQILAQSRGYGRDLLLNLNKIEFNLRWEKMT
jgi:hypothetical protein